jgi:hypothetical protein
MVFEKKNVRKIKNATNEELGKLRKEYEAFVGGMHGMSVAGLLVIGLAGIAVILYFQSNLFDFVGLAMLLYPLYILIQRGAHREGYFEGYYEMMTKASSRDEQSSAPKTDQQ